MNVKRFSLIASVFFLLLSTCSASIDTPILLRIPFRFAPGSTIPETLTATDFRMTVNGESRTPENLLRHYRRIMETRGRNRIILAFTSGHPGEHLRPFLDLIYQKLLSAGDQLLLCSPLSTFTVPLPAYDGEAFPQKAFIRLNDDLATFNGMISNLANQLSVIAADFPGKKGSAPWIKGFTRYQQEVVRIEQHLLAAILSRLGEGLRSTTDGEPYPWLILFDENKSLKSRISWPFGNPGLLHIPKEADGLVARLGTRLAPGREPGLSDLADQLMLRRISLIALIPPGTSPDVQTPSTYLEYICSRCGIEPIVFQTPAAAVSRIASMEDRLFELVYPFDGNVGDKQYRLLVNDGQSLAFPPRLKADFFRSLTGKTGGTSLALNHLGVEGENIVIEIGGINVPQEEGGRVRVRVQVRDENGSVRFDQEKELTAGRTEMKIRLPFPERVNGYFGLSVHVTDLNTLRSTEKRMYGKK